MSFLRKRTPKSYNYFDTPDGQDTHKKLFSVMKPTALVAFGLGTADVLALSQPKGYIKTLGRYVYIALPVFGVTTAFVLTTNILASIRHQDDRKNWFAGGFAAGTIIGAWARKPMLGFNMGMAMGTFAAIHKDAQMSGYRLFPASETFKVRNGTIWTVHQDFSLTKERPRNWVTKID